MDGYPADYIGHNLPFVILYGIGSTERKPLLPAERDYPLLQEKGIYISSELPNVTGIVADQLLAAFHEFDAKDASWNSRPGQGKMGTMGFTYRTVGRAYTLPPRKANPPAEPFDDVSKSRPTSGMAVLHSLLSPLTPGSPTFPDGLMTPLWFSKHQVLLPSAMISFFNFSMEASSSTLHDNRLKGEINALRTSITNSSYKFRLLVVLVADADGSDMLTNDRLANIRRGTNLDPRSLFLMPSGLQETEIGGFVGTVLASLQSSCVEYYRELSKHARRKKSRSTIPSPTSPPVSGTSQTLSQQGWTVRYETKLGYFAEFQQQMDAAGHNYETAYENLVDGELIESIPSWSPRFDEARMLADVLATRILRCLLWTGQTTSAAQSWANHRYRMLDLVNRKGKGSGTYGWQAWEARWSSVMAELIERVDVPIFQVPDHPRLDPTQFEVPDIYAIPEKSFAGEERLPPWDLLHHEGYWYRRSATRTLARRRLAMLMPKEDRGEPGQSPASAIASRTHLYDTYLCPEPHFEYALGDKPTFDHSALLIETLGKAAVHFSKREQKRAFERACLEIAQEHMKSRRWKQAWLLLEPLWRNLSWRKSGWWVLVEELSWAIRACAKNLDDGETLLVAEWELMSDLFTPRSGSSYNLSTCLDDLDLEERPHAIVDADALAPCMTATFTFGMSGGYVGEVLPAQLVIASRAQPKSTPITLNEIDLAFDGGLRAVLITHSYEAEPAAASINGIVEYFETAVPESKLSTAVSSPTTPTTPRIVPSLADLTFRPGQKKVFLLHLIPRDSGEVRATQAVLSIREESFFFDLSIRLREPLTRVEWWQPHETTLIRRNIDLEQHIAIAILPKPPKLQIDLPSWKKAYYFGEIIHIVVRLHNEEIDAADIRLHIALLGIAAPKLEWSSDDPDETNLEGRSIGSISPGEYREETVSFLAPQELSEFSFEIRADYTLAADPNTPISKTLKETLSISQPFEASHEFHPRIHPDPWPNYFNTETIDGDESSPQGLKQKWQISSKITSLATADLIIKSIELKVLEAKDILVTSIASTASIPATGIPIQSQSLHSHTTDLTFQKPSLEDHRPSGLNAELQIRWERLSPFPNATSTTTILPLPSFSPSFSEPRLIASSTPSTTIPSAINLTYTLENPSMHVLTFSVNMEASEEFAFSGLKSATVQLLPLSRKDVRYTIFPTGMPEGVAGASGRWMRPGFRCLDVGFGKVLRCIAGEGMGTDRARGVVIWVDGE